MLTWTHKVGQMLSVRFLLYISHQGAVLELRAYEVYLVKVLLEIRGGSRISEGGVLEGIIEKLLECNRIWALT